MSPVLQPLTVLAYDAASVQEWLMHYRPILEVLGLVFAAALIGFLTARYIYRGQVGYRTRELRAEHMLSRRRLADARNGLAKARDERARIMRRIKREQYSVRSADPQS